MRILVYIAVLLGILTGSCDAELKVKKRAVKAFEYYGDGEKYKAARMFDKMVEKYPESNFTVKNIYNAAIIYDEIDSNSLAYQRYQRLLRLDIDDQEKDSSRDIGETRANYKHIACKNIGSIYYDWGEFRHALRYYNNSTFMYPYYSDSAASIKKHSIELDRLRASCHENLGNIDSALILTLQHAFTKSPWNAHPSKKRALDLIFKHYDPLQIQSELEIAFENLSVSRSVAYLPWRGYKVHIIPYDQTIDEFTPSAMKQTSLYIDLYRHNHIIE